MLEEDNIRFAQRPALYDNLKPVGVRVPEEDWSLSGFLHRWRSPSGRKAAVWGRLRPWKFRGQRRGRRAHLRICVLGFEKQINMSPCCKRYCCIVTELKKWPLFTKSKI